MKDSFINGDEGGANLATRLRALGIGPRRSRTDALIHFGASLPAKVLADLLNLTPAPPSVGSKPLVAPGPDTPPEGSRGGRR